MARAKWTDDQIDKLKSLAGKVPAQEIAAELGRTSGSLAVQASKVKIPLRYRLATKNPSRAPPAPE